MATDPSNLATASEIMKGVGALLGGVAAIITSVTVAVKRRNKPTTEAISASEAKKSTEALERIAFRIRIVIYALWAVCLAIGFGYFLYYVSLDRPTKLFVVITVIGLSCYWALIREFTWFVDHYLIVRKLLKERKNA